jgi:phosphatidylinositol alpha-mannosyltransferase
MRIALTHPYSWPEVRRGAERIIQELSRAFAARGHEVTVFTAGSRAEVLRDDGVTIVRLRQHFPAGYRHEREFGWRLLRRLVTGRYDVVHSLMVWDALAAIRTARVAKHRTVYTNLGNPISDWWDARPDGAAHRRVVRDVDVYGCMSQHSLSVLESEFGRRGVLTPGGVNLESFRPMARDDHPTILFSGAVNENHKGLPVLLRAIDLLAPSMPQLQMWISGPGDADRVLADAPPIAVARTRVLDLGDPEEQGERYARAWVTALPSKGDSFGMVLVESLACGTPIVSSTHAAPPELVDVGVTGAVCEPDDDQGLAAALRTALELARRESTVAACRASASRFDWNTGIAPALEAVYDGSVSDT